MKKCNSCKPKYEGRLYGTPIFSSDEVFDTIEYVDNNKKVVLCIMNPNDLRFIKLDHQIDLKA